MSEAVKRASGHIKEGDMRGTSFRALQAFLWMICAFHVIVGVGLNLSSAIPAGMASYYGAQVDWTFQFVYILKPLGAFMFVLGILAAYAARNPLGNKMIVYGFVTLFAIRSLQRVVFGGEIYAAFAIAPGRNIGNAVFFMAMALALFALYRFVARSDVAPGPAAA
jgi:hypothetical protein